MKNKYKVVALVPLEFSVEGSSDSKEAIESVKNIFEACRNDNDCADIVFDGIEESLRHDSIEYKVEAAQPEPEVKANSDIRSVASDICDVFENYLDENGVYIVCDDADEEQDRKANESGAMLYGMEYWHLVEDVEFRVNHINAQYKLFTVFDIMDFGNAFATTDVFVNPRKGIPFVQCSTENQLSDFRKADSHE